MYILMQKNNVTFYWHGNATNFNRNP